MTQLSVWQRAAQWMVRKAFPGSQLTLPDSRGGWWPIVREPWTGAWQTNTTVELANVLTYSTVFACITLIASDIAKMNLRLVKQDDDGIWVETENASFSPVLRKPNGYQTRIKFIEQWILSKLSNGNTYVLKARDQRNVVTAMYVLDPTRVQPLIAPDGSVFYELKKDDLSQQPESAVIVPARAIIHDVCVPLYHPLVGVSPLHACGLAATQGLRIQTNSTNLFTNGSFPGGVITVPGAISQAQADKVKQEFNTLFSGTNAGNTALLGDGMQFEKMTMTAVDAQLIEQLKWTSETICSAYHVPPYMVGVGPPPNYNNIQALSVQYFTQCIQALVESLELVLDEGLGLAPDKIGGVRFGTEFDTNDLLRMDTATLIASEETAKNIKTPNESRRVLNLPPVKGGDTVYRQQQDFSLAALSRRDESGPAPLVPGPGSAAPASDTPTGQKPASEMPAAAGRDFTAGELMASMTRVRKSLGLVA